MFFVQSTGYMITVHSKIGSSGKPYSNLTTMSCGYHRCLAIYVAVFLGMSMLLPPTGGAVVFTKTPKNTFVQVGDTVNIVWDYTVGNRNMEFQQQSPMWSYDRAGKKFILAYEDKFNSWKWTISPTCPARLRPRLSKVDTATLVITNVSLADSGKYECRLYLISGSVSSSFMQLNVTVPPQFTTVPPSSKTIKEGDNLSIQCSAKGPPIPQVQWLHSGNILSLGQGSATLNIVNIPRSQSGIYECQASNNPNEEPAKTTTSITVHYKPSIHKASSTNDVRSWKGNTITLKCMVASASPSPDFTWHKPNGDVISCNQCRKIVSSQITVQTGQDSGDYGLYRCTATNVVGSDQHYINVTQLFSPGRPTITVTDIEASSVIVRWTKPVYDGGSPVILYNLTIDSKIYVIDAPNTHKSLSGLTKNTKYEVQLDAKNIAGYGNASSKVFTTKQKGPPSSPELIKVNILETAVTLVWSKPDDNGGEIEAYTIYKKVIGMDVSWTKVVNVTATSYKVEDLEPGKTYRFLVTASNRYGESLKDESEAETVVIPAKTIRTTEEQAANITPTATVSTMVGVLATFLTVSLLVNILFVLYIWRVPRQRKQRELDNPIYENTINRDNSSLAACAAHAPTKQQASEYESVGLSSVHVKPQYAETSPLPSKYEIPDKGQASQGPGHYERLNPSTKSVKQENPDNGQTNPSPIHYQQLNPSAMTSHESGNPPRMYEPLRLNPMST